MWKVFIDKTEAEVYDKIKMISQRRRCQGLRNCVPLVHGCVRLGSIRAGKATEHPNPPNGERKHWQNMWSCGRTSSQARSPWRSTYKINPLRMLMIDKPKEYFDLWEADCEEVGQHDPEEHAARD